MDMQKMRRMEMRMIRRMGVGKEESLRWRLKRWSCYAGLMQALRNG